MFPEATSGMAISGSICSACLVAVVGKDTKYCSRYPYFPQVIKCGHRLACIEWCKLLGALMSIGFGLLGSVLEVLLNLDGCWNSIADPGWYSGTYLAVVQHLIG